MRTANRSDKKSFPYGILLGLVAGVLLLALCTGGAFAYLKLTAEKELDNTLTPSQQATLTIGETFEAPYTVKSDVYVQVPSTGYSYYVRAAIVAVWKSTDGSNVSSATPLLNKDYTLKLNTEDWFLYNGFYYHKSPVYNNGSDSDGKTERLIEECKLKSSPPDGYLLEVKIVAQTIQVAGSTDEDDIPAVQANWGVVPNSTTKQLEPPH